MANESKKSYLAAEGKFGRFARESEPHVKTTHRRNLRPVYKTDTMGFQAH